MIDFGIAIVQQAVDLQALGGGLVLPELDISLEQELVAFQVLRIGARNGGQELDRLIETTGIDTATGQGNAPTGISRPQLQALLQDLDRLGILTDLAIFLRQVQIDPGGRITFPKKLELFDAVGIARFRHRTPMV